MLSIFSYPGVEVGIRQNRNCAKSHRTVATKRLFGGTQVAHKRQRTTAFSKSDEHVDYPSPATSKSEASSHVSPVRTHSLAARAPMRSSPVKLEQEYKPKAFPRSGKIVDWPASTSTPNPKPQAKVTVEVNSSASKRGSLYEQDIATQRRNAKRYGVEVREPERIVPPGIWVCGQCGFDHRLGISTRCNNPKCQHNRCIRPGCCKLAGQRYFQDGVGVKVREVARATPTTPKPLSLPQSNAILSRFPNGKPINAAKRPTVTKASGQSTNDKASRTESYKKPVDSLLQKREQETKRKSDRGMYITYTISQDCSMDKESLNRQKLQALQSDSVSPRLARLTRPVGTLFSRASPQLRANVKNLQNHSR